MFQRVFLEGNPYLLGITLIVSMLHSIFDFFAFKNCKLGLLITWFSIWVYSAVLALFYQLLMMFSVICCLFITDIQFWNKNKSMEGLSAKSVVVSFIFQLIVFLYLLDNETSWMIIASSGVGCCIEFWKIGKAMHIEVLHFVPRALLFSTVYWEINQGRSWCVLVF